MGDEVEPGSMVPPPGNAPAHPPRPVSDPALADLIGLTLRIGVLLSAAVVVVAYAVIMGRGLPRRSFHHFTATPITGRWGILDVLISIRDRHSPADFVTLGLIILVFTPVVRVAMSWVIFLYERDKLYAALTVVVLTTLLFSLFGGSF